LRQVGTGGGLLIGHGFLRCIGIRHKSDAE
jgi:hypothetical protein